MNRSWMDFPGAGLLCTGGGGGGGGGPWWAAPGSGSDHLWAGVCSAGRQVLRR